MMYLHNLCVALDQFLNTLLGGYPDETLSARSYMQRNKAKRWRIMMHIINCLLLDREHCKNAFYKEIDLPKEYQDSWDDKY